MLFEEHLNSYSENEVIIWSDGPSSEMKVFFMEHSKIYDFQCSNSIHLYCILFTFDLKIYDCIIPYRTASQWEFFKDFNQSLDLKNLLSGNLGDNKTKYAKLSGKNPVFS